jgi:integrase
MRAAVGSIERLGKDYYRVRIDLGYKEDGKRNRPSKNIRGKREKAETALAKMFLDNGFDPMECDGNTFASFWETIYADTFDELSKGTAKNLECSYSKYLKPMFGEMCMSSLTKRIIEKSISTIEKPYAREHAFKAMRQCFNYGFGDELLSDNPFLRRLRVKHPRHIDQPVMDIDYFGTWFDSMKGYRFEAAMLVIIGGGTRREEAACLTWDDFDWETVMVGVRKEELCIVRIDKAVTVYEKGDTKTERSTRSIVISGAIAKRLHELSGSGYLVSNAAGELANPQILYTTYKRWCEKKGIDYYTMRSLRTTYATWQQANEEVKDTTVSRAMGHTKLAVDYKHYFMVNKKSYIKAAIALSDSLDPSCPQEEKRPTGKNID